MFGFVIGTICLVLLIGVLRRRWYPGSYGHRWRGHGPRAFLWRLLRRIDATPAQEKIFRDEAEGFWEAAGGLREGLKASRRDLALAMRDEALDKQKLAAMFRVLGAFNPTARGQEPHNFVHGLGCHSGRACKLGAGSAGSALEDIQRS